MSARERSRVIVALDTRSLDDALALARVLAGRVGATKLGKEFFIAHGPQGVRQVVAESGGLPLFLDLKLHDIPNTVAGGVASALSLGPAMITVHASGGAAMLRAAVTAAADAGSARPQVLAVTVLTSLGDGDLASVGQRGPASEQVVRLARLAQDAGCDGVIAAPTEVAALRKACGPTFRIVTPGVRPSWAGSDDQHRVATPAEAIAAGADALVIGRPITRATDPAAAADRIVAELAA